MPTSVTAAMEAYITRYMGGVVDKSKRSSRFLTDFLFPQNTWEPIENTQVQIDQEVFDPVMAPFIERGGEAVQMARQSGDSYVVKMPYISLKMPMNATSDLLKRHAGETNILTGARTGDIRKRLQKKIIEDLRILDTSISEREEWMVAQLLQGSITYQDANRATFEITFAKPAGNTIILSPFWDQASATPRIDIDVQIKRQQANVNQGPDITDAIVGEEAADTIRDLIENDTLKLYAKEQRNVATGALTVFEEKYNDYGVVKLGVLNGISFWEYGASVTDEAGTTTSLIRTKYIEFVSQTAKAKMMRKMYYGVIDDMDAIMANQHVTRRYVTSEIKKDPSVFVQYMRTSPLPVDKRPDWLYSMKVVSG